MNILHPRKQLIAAIIRKTTTTVLPQSENGAIRNAIHRDHLALSECGWVGGWLGVTDCNWMLDSEGSVKAEVGRKGLGIWFWALNYTLIVRCVYVCMWDDDITYLQFTTNTHDDEHRGNEWMIESRFQTHSVYYHMGERVATGHTVPDKGFRLISSFILPGRDIGLCVWPDCCCCWWLADKEKQNQVAPLIQLAGLKTL